MLPVDAVANVSIRLAPGQQVDEIAAAMERLLREAAPPEAELEIELLSAAPPGIVSPGRQGGAAGAGRVRAHGRACGRR